MARLPKDPSAVGSLKKASQAVRSGRETYRLDNITQERSLTNPHPLARHFTNFRQHFDNPISIPKDLMHPHRARRDSRYMVDVGDLPED